MRKLQELDSQLMCPDRLTNAALCSSMPLTVTSWAGKPLTGGTRWDTVGHGAIRRPETNLSGSNRKSLINWVTVYPRFPRVSCSNSSQNRCETLGIDSKRDRQRAEPQVGVVELHRSHQQSSWKNLQSYSWLELNHIEPLWCVSLQKDIESGFFTFLLGAFTMTQIVSCASRHVFCQKRKWTFSASCWRTRQMLSGEVQGFLERQFRNFKNALPQ